MPSTNRNHSWEEKTLFYLRRMHVDTETLASVVSGGALDVNVVGGGTSGTQYTTQTDSFSAGSTIVTGAGVVYKNSPGNLVTSDGEFTMLQVDSTGALRVTGGASGGDASEAKQDVQIDIASNMLTNLASIDSKTPALGAAIAAASVPVVYATDQLLQTNLGQPLPTGANVIGEVLITNLGPGTDAGSLGKLSGTTYVEGSDVGVAMWGVNSSNAYIPLQLDAGGNLLTNLASGGTTQYTSNTDTFAADATDGKVIAAGAVYDVEGNTSLPGVTTNLGYTPLAVDKMGSLRVSAPEGYASAVGVNSSTDDVGGVGTLETTINDTDDPVNVVLGSGEGSNFADGQIVMIDDEYLQIGSVSTDTLLNCVRARKGSAIDEHTAGTTVAGAFVGEWELSPFPDVMVSLKAGTGQTGTEYFDFSNDGGTSVDTFPVSGFEVGSFHEFHTAVKGSRYFRARYISSSSSIATDFRVYTYYGQFRSGNLPLNQSISSDADSTIVRAVTTGEDPQGTYGNVKRDGSAFRTADSAILGGGFLVSDITDSATTIQTNIGAGTITDFASNGYLYISSNLNQNEDGEYIQYTNYSAVTGSVYEFNLTNVDFRGIFGSTAAAHSAGDTVGEAYVGAFNGDEILDLQGFTQVQTQILSSNNGIGNFQWFTDSAGANSIRTLDPPYRTPGQYDFLAAPSFGPYVRYVFANTETTSTTQFYFETLFLTKSLSAQVLTVDSTILPQMTANLTRSVIAAQQPGGGFQNVNIGTKNDLLVSLVEPNTAFGEVSTQSPRPVAQLKFIYGVANEIGGETELFYNHGTEVTISCMGSASTCLSQSIYLPGGDVFASNGSANYFEITDASNISHNVWYSVQGGTATAPGGNDYQVTVASNALPSNVAGETSSMFASCLFSNFSASAFGNILTATARTTGAVDRSIIASCMPKLFGEASNISWSSLVSGTPGGGQVTIQNGAGVGSYATMRGTRQVRYQAGEGIIFRWTAMYDESTGGVEQFSGLGNSTNGLYIGYGDTSPATGTSAFMVSRRSQGKHHVAYLTVTAPNIAGTVVITLDGVTFEVPITATATAKAVAYEIASYDYSWGLYRAEVVEGATGTVVIFLSQRLNDTTDTFSFDDNGTGITATMTVNADGTAASRDDVMQSEFSIDTLDGNGPSGMILDPQKGNVYQIQYQWLGFGKIIFSVANPATGLFTPFHMYEYANTNTITSLTQPDMQITAFTNTTISTEQVNLKIASAAAFVEGEIEIFDPRFTVSNTHTDVSSGANRTICALYNPRTFNGITNQTQLLLTSLAVSSAPTGGNAPRSVVTFTLAIARNQDLQYDWLYNREPNANNRALSPIYVSLPLVSEDYLPTLETIEVFSIGVPASGSNFVDLKEKNILLYKGQTLYVIYNKIGANAVDIAADISWVEGQ